MEFDKDRWSCSWNSDQNCARGWGARGWEGYLGTGGFGGPGDWGGGLFDIKLTLSVSHNCLELKMII